jgi:hypothetical protein
MLYKIIITILSRYFFGNYLSSDKILANIDHYKRTDLHYH